MKVITQKIPDIKLIIPQRFGDVRGYFCETYNQRDLLAEGIDYQFVQDNQSRSNSVGVVRGLHYQKPPHAQAKLIRVVHGSILDVVVDIRHGSPYFGKHVSAKLTAEGGEQLLIPTGFAHGFMTLEVETEVFYKATDFYSPNHEEGIQWNDPDLNIKWSKEMAEEDITLSDKDKTLPRFKDITDVFTYSSPEGEAS